MSVPPRLPGVSEKGRSESAKRMYMNCALRVSSRRRRQLHQQPISGILAFTSGACVYSVSLSAHLVWRLASNDVLARCCGPGINASRWTRSTRAIVGYSTVLMVGLRGGERLNRMRDTESHEAEARVHVYSTEGVCGCLSFVAVDTDLATNCCASLDGKNQEAILQPPPIQQILTIPDPLMHMTLSV